MLILMDSCTMYLDVSGLFRQAAWMCVQPVKFKATHLFAQGTFQFKHELKALETVCVMFTSVSGGSRWQN